MRYNIYLGQIEKARTKRKLEKLLDLIGSDFAGINSRQYEELKFLILYKWLHKKKNPDEKPGFPHSINCKSLKYQQKQNITEKEKNQCVKSSLSRFRSQPGS